MKHSMKESQWTHPEIKQREDVNNNITEMIDGEGPYLLNAIIVGRQRNVFVEPPAVRLIRIAIRALNLGHGNVACRWRRRRKA